MRRYRTIDGDILDQIAKEQLGDEGQAVDILAINPGLAMQPFLMPAGLVIILPEAKPAAAAKTVRLWGART